jgi:hypothetical protein
MQLSPNNDAAIGEGDFFADLGMQTLPGSGDGREDELAADVSFGKRARHVGPWFLYFLEYACQANRCRKWLMCNYAGINA